MSTQHIAKKKHSRGPLHDDIDECEQYGEIHLPHFVLSIKEPDNAILVDTTTYIIKNIITYDHTRKIICQVFARKEDFFTYPTQSSRLNIWSVSNLNVDQLVLIDPRDIQSKIVLLPFKDKSISIPLL